jgi:hypothetical protein
VSEAATDGWVLLVLGERLEKTLTMKGLGLFCCCFFNLQKQQKQPTMPTRIPTMAITIKIIKWLGMVAGLSVVVVVVVLPAVAEGREMLLAVVKVEPEVVVEETTGLGWLLLLPVLPPVEPPVDPPGETQPARPPSKLPELLATTFPLFASTH